MERTDLSHRISLILSELSKLTNTLYAMDVTDISKYPDNYETLSIDAALRSETIAGRLRRLIFLSTSVSKADYMNSAGNVLNIGIEDKNGILEITLPCLLPKIRQRHRSDYLLDPLYYRLGDYAENHALPTYRHCVICFSHIYNRDLPLQRVRDYDNLEIKQILDVISTYIMEDDTGLLCDAYNTTELGDTDCTRISVMAQDRFLDWLSTRENRLKSISDF